MLPIASIVPGLGGAQKVGFLVLGPFACGKRKNRENRQNIPGQSRARDRLGVLLFDGFSLLIRPNHTNPECRAKPRFL